MSNTSLIWIIAALLFLLVASVVSNYEANKKIDALKKEMIIMSIVDEWKTSK
jgi:hypothetical protein